MTTLNIERKLSTYMRENNKSHISFIKSFISNPAQADDILGEAYAVLAEKMNAGAYSEGLPPCLKATMHDICTFKCLEYISKRKSQAKKAGTDTISYCSRDDEDYAGREADELEIESFYACLEQDQASYLAKLEWTMRQINSLSANHKTIIIGYYLEKKSLAQIAKEIGSTANSVKTTKERIIKKLCELAKTADIESESEAILGKVA